MNNIKTNLLFLILIAFIFVMYMMLWFVESFDVFHWVAYRYSITGERLDVLTRYINGDTWTKLKWAIAIVFLFISYLFYFDRNIFKDHLASFRLLYQTIKEELKNIQTVNVYLITIVGFLFFIFLLIYSAVTPLQLDELDTWLFFIDKGPLVTMAYYPSNNNHIAYNLLSVFWSCFLSPVWTVRMVSMLSGTGVVFLFYLILKRRYDTVFSFAGILLLISSAPFVAYAIQGRGYVLELLGLMLFLYVLWHMEPSIYTDRLLVVCNTFIVYVVPVAILPLGLLNMYYAYHLVKEDTKNTKRIFQMAFYSGMFILICYAPVWIFSGFNQILNNPFVRRISFQEAPHEALFTYGPELWNFISGCESNLNESLFLILCIGSLVMLFKQERTIWLSFGVLVFPLVLLLLYPVLLFERTWLWLVIPYLFWFLEVSFFMKQFKKTVGYLFLCVVSIVLVVANGIRLYDTNKLLVEHATQFSALREYIETHGQDKKIRVYDDATYSYLRFYQLSSVTHYSVFYNKENNNIPTEWSLILRDGHRPSDDMIVWSNRQYILYAPKEY